jgi:predicted Zn-dependent protease
MKIINIAFSLFLVNCSIVTTQSEDFLGVAYGGNCDLGKMPTLVIDPDWSEDQSNKIRAGAKQWEDAVGVDFGNLDISKVDCGIPNENWVKGCIARANNMNDVCVYDSKDGFKCVKAKGAGIVIGKTSPDLQQVAAHEFGHWIGIGHINNSMALMYPNQGQDELTDIDINEYDKVCHE